MQVWSIKQVYWMVIMWQQWWHLRWHGTPGVHQIKHYHPGHQWSPEWSLLVSFTRVQCQDLVAVVTVCRISYCRHLVVTRSQCDPTRLCSDTATTDHCVYNFVIISKCPVPVVLTSTQQFRVPLCVRSGNSWILGWPDNCVSWIISVS